MKNRSFSSKVTALWKKCSIFAALILIKDEYQRVHYPEWRVYFFSKGIISDNSIFEFLDKVGTDNSTETKVDVFSSSQVISNDACDDFANFVRVHETNLPSKEYILHTLDSYKMLIHIQEYKKAAWELQKVVDLICSTYQTDKCSQLSDSLKEKPITKDTCQSALRTISELYMNVYSSPHKQFQSENHTVTLSFQWNRRTLFFCVSSLYIYGFTFHKACESPFLFFSSFFDTKSWEKVTEFWGKNVILQKK